jgi:hypothetical protein
MRRAILRFSCLCSLAFAAGCGGTGGNLPEPPRPRQDRDYISTDEVRASNAVNAYEAISSLRAAWLTRKRGEQSVTVPTDIVVYYNNARMGGLESLRQISLGTVTWIRYFDARRAQYRYGTGHSQGAILVSSEIEQQAAPPRTERRP